MAATASRTAHLLQSLKGVYEWDSGQCPVQTLHSMFGQSCTRLNRDSALPDQVPKDNHAAIDQLASTMWLACTMQGKSRSMSPWRASSTL